nr:ribonuclease H-like domain-containing protein [Tanacetum cinerariifolium]
MSDAADDDQPTLISKPDLSSPLHLHPNDSATLTVISVKLKGTENYQRSNTDEVLGRQWDRVNDVVLGWILNSISKELFLGQIFSKRAKHVCDELKETYDKVDGSFDALVQLLRCTCHVADDFKKHNQLMKLMQFLMGLDDCYMKIRSNILFRDELPDVRSAYAIISSEESHRRSQASASNDRTSTVTRPLNNGNRGPNNGSTLVCKNYGFNGYTIDRCFKIIGYPADFGKRNGNNNSSANQHLTIRIRLKSLIFHILVSLFHIPMGLKLVSPSNLIVAFDESKCFVLPQDLRDLKVLGTSSQIDGLYYFDNDIHVICSLTKGVWHSRLGYPSEHVLRVLKNDINFEETKIDFCEICQMAKQTREPFPLSDHKSLVLGELVHLEIWGPYKVTSKEEFRFFVTVVDDYTRAVWVYMLKSKDEVFDCILVFYNLLKNQFGKSVKVFRGDNGTEFTNKIFEIFCANNADQRSMCWLGTLMLRKTITTSDHSQDLDHSNFFDNLDVEIPDTPYNEERVANKSDSDGSNSSQDDEMATTTEDTNNSSEGVIGDVQHTKVENNDANQLGDLKDLLFFLKDIMILWLIQKLSMEACKDQHWVEAMNKEMDTLYKNDTWDITDLLIVQNNWGRSQLDINNVFLYGDLFETVYIDLPEVYFSPDDKRVCILKKSLYGLKQVILVKGFILLGNLKASLEAFVDADWAKCLITRKSVTWFSIKLNGSLISWKSNKQHTLSKSSVEAEYRAMASVTSKVIWILKILKDLEWDQVLPVNLFCDSQAAIKIAANPVFHERTKHLEIGLHFIRDKILAGVIKTQKIGTTAQPADIFTKRLDKLQHENLISKLGLIDVFQVLEKGRTEGGHVGLLLPI